MKRFPSTIGGITATQARKISEGEFEDSLINFYCNDKTITYDILVKEPIDIEIIKKFKKRWNNAFRIIPVELKNPI